VLSIQQIDGITVAAADLSRMSFASAVGKVMHVPAVAVVIGIISSPSALVLYERKLLASGVFIPYDVITLTSTALNQSSLLTQSILSGQFTRTLRASGFPPNVTASVLPTIQLVSPTSHPTMLPILSPSLVPTKLPVSTPSTSPTAALGSDTSPASAQGQNVGAIVGGVIGGLAGVALLIGAVYFLKRAGDHSAAVQHEREPPPRRYAPDDAEDFRDAELI
jgi:hypothetical protein